MDKPLRILAVVPLPWDPRFGAARVWIELTEEWTKAGHVVEKFCLTDAFPGRPASRITATLRPWLFIYKAALFVRKHGKRFDVIDALIGSLPFSKRGLRFKGLLVARSVGLPRHYDQFERSMEKRWPQIARGTVAGRILRAFLRWRFLRAADNSIQRADLINLPNEEEAISLRREAGKKLRLIVQPFGLTIEQSLALGGCALPTPVRLERKKICFIGMWGARKGSYDWSHIIKHVRKRVPGASFCFLGTMIDSKIILRDCEEGTADAFQCVSEYQPKDLPGLLADCTVGAFPSYVEGFGLAVIEQLAAGIPTVAYDVAGPRDILGASLPELLVPAGDTASFAETISGILRASHEQYESLSKRSVEAASRFSWPAVAHHTAQSYQIALTELTART